MYFQIKGNIKKKHFRLKGTTSVSKQPAQQEPSSLEEQHPPLIPLLEQGQSIRANQKASGFIGYWIQNPSCRSKHFNCPLKQIPVLKSLSLKEPHCTCSKAQNKITSILIQIFQFPSCYSVTNTGKGLFLRKNCQPANMESSEPTCVSTTVFSPAFSLAVCFGFASGGDTATAWHTKHPSQAQQH